MKQKGNKHSMDITVRGRTFLVGFYSESVLTPSPREFDKALEEAITQGDQRGLGRINGTGKNSLDQKFHYEEVTSDEDLEIYYKGEALRKFLDDLDSLSGISREAMLEVFGKTWQKVIDRQISPSEGAQSINNIITQERNKQRFENQQQFFNIAEKWAHKEDQVTMQEACHGVAYDLYRFTHPEEPQVMVQQEYGSMFDRNFANQIKERQIRSARELFGDPK